MKEMLKAVPVLTKLMGVQPHLIRAHARNGIGDIGRYVIVTPGKNMKQYYIMKSDIPRVLHRGLTDNEIEWLEEERS